MLASRQSPPFASGKNLPTLVKETVFPNSNLNSDASFFALRDSENAKEVMETDGAYLTVTAMSRHPTHRSGFYYPLSTFRKTYESAVKHQTSTAFLL